MISAGMIEQQEYQGSDDTSQQIDRELVEMCDDGLLLSICPICHIPMDHNELKALTCGTCGNTLDFENILFQSIEHIPKG